MNDEELLAWVEGLVKILADEYGSEPDDQRGLEALRARLSLQQDATRELKPSEVASLNKTLQQSLRRVCPTCNCGAKS